VRTAQAKGVRPRRVLARHIFPVAAIPVLVLAGSPVNLLITNIGLMQSAFDIPGSYREMGRALANADVALLQARLDPRVRQSMSFSRRSLH
jgi:peptide/nickel transport system permease protein